MFKKLFKYLTGFLFCLFAVAAQLEAAEDAVLKHYDESIYIISNFSGTDATVKETRSVQQLLDLNIGGFRFYLEWERQQNQLVLVDGQGQASPFIEQLITIRKHLENKPEKILTLFLDFNVNVNELSNLIDESGIQPYLFEYTKQGQWPSLKEMVDSGKRLIIFCMQEHRNSPDWLHYIWDYAVEPYYSILEAPVFAGEFLKGDPRNNLLIYNDYNMTGKSGQDNASFFNTTQNPYLIEHVKGVWKNTGKTPNFIFLDRYGNWILQVLYQLRSFKTIKGTVTFNTQILGYVSWEGTNSLTSGKFCFPLGPGESMTLTPKSPGYSFKPESVSFEEPSQNKVQHFVGMPLEITEELEAHYNFENGMHDQSMNNFNGKDEGVEYRKDSIRGIVGWFNGKSHVVLPRAEDLKLRDHDFTVSAWVKIDRYERGKNDYCILGTTGGSYQQSIHLVIREGRPYFGFYSNDLQGKSRIEAGRWYHIVWRYSKLNGEQAIYIDGKLDSRSMGHPSYKGKDDIFMGLAGYNPASNMLGSLDDLTIWSRTLGEEEIWSLSKDLLDLTPQKTIFSRYPLLSKIGIVLVALLFLFWLYRKLPFRTYWKQPLSPEKMKELQDPDFGSYPSKNFIQLFGDFKVVDRNGLDITGQFTPKIKQLFLLILVFSQQSKKGITTKELSDTLWPDLNYQSAKNSRGVTIRKLRLILESMEKADVLFHIDCWTMRFSGSIYCDYVECLKLLNETHDHQNDFYADFYKVVGAGKVFKGESHDWLDVYAGNVGNNIIDILMNFIGKLDMERDHELILKLADRILITDPVNDQALSFKLRALVLQNNMNTARFTYDQYAVLYHELYNEPLSMSFNDFLKS